MKQGRKEKRKERRSAESAKQIQTTTYEASERQETGGWKHANEVDEDSGYLYLPR